MSEPQPPQLPPEAPVELREFIACQRASVTIASGKLDWLPVPPDSGLPVPEITLEPGATPGTGTITVTLGFISFGLGVSIVDGRLHIDASGLPPLLSAAAEPLETWVRDFNAFLASRGKRLKPASIRGGAVTLEKEPIPAGQPPAAGAAPSAGGAAGQPAPPGGGPPVPPPPAGEPKSGGPGGWCSLLLLGLVAAIGLGIAAVATGVVPMPGGNGASSPGPSVAQTGAPASLEPSTGVASPSPVVEASASAVAAPPSEAPSAPSVPPAVGVPAAVDALVLAGILTSDQAAAIDWVEDERGDIVHVDPAQQATMTNPEVDIVGHGTTNLELDAAGATAFNALAPCGDLAGPAIMLCNRTDAMPAGSYVLVIVQVAGPLPQPPFPDPNLWSWAAVFGDGDPSTGAAGGGNVFTTGAELYYEAIFFHDRQGADRGYVLATDERKPARSDTGEVHGNLPSHARFVGWREAGVLAAFLPAAEAADLSRSWTGDFVQDRAGGLVGVDRTDERPFSGAFPATATPPP